MKLDRKGESGANLLCLSPPNQLVIKQKTRFRGKLNYEIILEFEGGIVVKISNLKEG